MKSSVLCYELSLLAGWLQVFCLQRILNNIAGTWHLPENILVCYTLGSSGIQNVT